MGKVVEGDSAPRGGRSKLLVVNLTPSLYHCGLLCRPPVVAGVVRCPLELSGDVTWIVFPDSKPASLQDILSHILFKPSSELCFWQLGTQTDTEAFEIKKTLPQSGLNNVEMNSLL